MRQPAFIRALCAAVLVLGATLPVRAADLVETPFFAPAVKAGTLPPVAERMPTSQRVIDLPAVGRETGKSGGLLRMLMGDQRDIRMMTIYGYTRLVAFDEKLELQADILDSYEQEGDRVFTLHIRPGHKWSDGHLFTADDFKYWWEGVANDKRLSPGGPPVAMLAGGKPPKFEVIDPLTVRYSWGQPNPSFLSSLADSQPLYIYMPAHYLKQFHTKYADKDKLAEAVKANKVKDWGALHERMSRQYRPENPELPTLEPWRNTTKPPAEVFVFERNPYFHRRDQAGNQLPYIDRVQMMLGTSSLIPAKVGGGESDLQARYLRFDNYTFLKAAADRNNYDVRLWDRGQGAYVALMPNLNVTDPVWRKIVHDVRFRRGVSLAVNRQDINRVIFFGLARESANTVVPQSPLYKAEYASAWSTYDLDQANRLLDEAGLAKRDDDGVRLLPDGRRAEIIVESGGDSTEETDVLELVGDDLLKVGLKIYSHAAQLDVFRKRIRAGQTVMSIAPGLDNAAAGPEMEPSELAPSNESQFQWALWGQYVESGGKDGQAIDLPEAKALDDLHKAWRASSTPEERRSIWEKMLAINADQVFTIGIVNNVKQPITVTRRLRNVPAEGLWSFEPGAFFGVYRPDTFWFTDAAPVK